MENHFKYADCIYFRDAESLYVNLFLNSHVRWREKEIMVTQRVGEKADRISVSLTVSGSSRFRLQVRRPYWCGQVPAVRVNGAEADVTAKDGYWVLDRVWKDGDRVEFSYVCSARLEHAPDDPGKVVVCWGPYVLAALTDSKEYLRLHVGGKAPEDLLTPMRDGAGFRLKGGNVKFLPLCRVEDQNYQVYLQDEL